MQPLVIGVHQRNAPVALREQLAFTERDLPRALPALRRFVGEGAILSTCHRTEIYAVEDGNSDAESGAWRFLEQWHGQAAEQARPYLYVKQGSDAARHLFRLAAGLDSMVLGEDQILSQLKGALDAAHETAVLGPTLHRLLECALAAGKLVRTETSIARGHLSAVSVVLDLARQGLGSLAHRRVLVIGAGVTGELALKHLRDEPDALVTLANRTADRAEAVAARHGARTWPFDRLGEAVAETDLILSCTAAPSPILNAAMVAEAMEHRGGRPLLIFDLAVPRDIDPAAAAISGVQLFDVDILHELSAANRETRAAEIARADALIETGVAAFAHWLAAQDRVPTIRALREHAESIRAREVERALAHLPDLSPHQRQSVEALTSAIVNKLLHQPTVSLKDPVAGNGLALATRRLFALQPSGGE